MDTPPTLQEYLATHPYNTANDYYLLYGKPEEDDIFEFARLEPEPEEQAMPTYVEPQFSVTRRPSLDILSLVGAVLILVGFFLPWVDFSAFKLLKEGTTASGLSVSSSYFQFPIGKFSELASLTVYLIILGAVITLVGNFLRKWATRMIGQMIAICFIVFWAYLLITLWQNEAFRPKDLGLFSFFQYGFYVLFFGCLLNIIGVVRNLFVVPK